MLPIESINPKVNTSATIVQSRAYTFLDSYLYMKNGKYNALYEKNKQILAVEKDAMSKSSAEILYYAASEQTANLNSIIIRIRNFAQSVRNDVINNLLQIIPEVSDIDAFEEAIAGCANLPKQKVLKYEISPISYPNMAIFLGLFRKELNEMVRIDAETASISDPFIHKVATKFLINSTDEYARAGLGILEKESMVISTVPELNRIKSYFRKKSMILTAVNRDFRVFYFYLRQYRILQQVLESIKPTTMQDGKIIVGPNNNSVVNSFSDYLIIYKHYSMIIKHLMDTVSYFDSKFFNKIYAIQSNIEMYVSIMNDTVSVYRTRMRNVNEAFNEISGIVSSRDTTADMLNDDTSDEIEIKDDYVFKADVPESEIEYPEDVYDSDNDDYDLDFDEDDFEEIEPSDEDDLDYPDFEGDDYTPAKVSGDLDLQDIIRKQGYELVHPADCVSCKKQVIQEAIAAQANAKQILDGIITAIHDANAKFKDYAKTLREENGGILEDARNLSIDSMDLSGISFEMYKYSKGVEYMNHIRIPNFRTDDADLLTEDGSLGYKQKYFKDLYYFSQKGCPLNLVRFRGSQAKKVIEEANLVSAFNWFMQYIDNYSKVISAISASNTRIQNCIKASQKLIAPSDGGTNEKLVEAIILNRSIFRNDIYDILLESDMVSMKEIEEAIPLKEEPKETTEEKPVPEKTEEKPVDETKDTKLNIDDASADEANNIKKYGDAMRMYCKIAYEVNSTRMNIYEEIYQTAFRFIKIIVDSSK